MATFVEIVRGSSKSVVDSCLALLYKGVEYIVPTSDSACFISFPDVDDNALALFSEVLKDQRYGRENLVWLVENLPAAEERLRARCGAEAVSRSCVIQKNTIRGFWRFLRAQRVYFTHGHYRFVRSSRSKEKLINLWHGMPLKAVGLLDGKSNDCLQTSDKTIASSEFFRPIMAKAFGLQLADVGVTGLPRCDELVRPTAAALKFRRELLQDAERLLVWLPTYAISDVNEIRNDSTLTRETCLAEFVESMRRLAGRAIAHRCHVLVKLHPADFLNGESIQAPRSITLVTAKTFASMNIGLYELLAVADGLITDLSSVCFDYMATGRPILLDTTLIARYRRALVFDPVLLTRAVRTASNWLEAEPFFEAVHVRERLRSPASSTFCQHADARSAARVLSFAPLVVAGEKSAARGVKSAAGHIA